MEESNLKIEKDINNSKDVISKYEKKLDEFNIYKIKIEKLQNDVENLQQKIEKLKNWYKYINFII